MIRCLLLLVELFLIGLGHGDSRLVIPSLLFFAPFLFCNFSFVWFSFMFFSVFLFLYFLGLLYVLHAQSSLSYIYHSYLSKKKKKFQLALILVSTSERMYQGLKLICHVHVYFWSSYKVVNNLRWYTWQYLGVKSPPFLHKVYVIDWNRFKKVLSCSDNLYEKFKFKLWPIRIKKKFEVMTYVFLARGMLCNALDDDLVVVQHRYFFAHTEVMVNPF